MMNAEIDVDVSNSEDFVSIGGKEITDIIVAVDDSTVALDVLVIELLS